MIAWDCFAKLLQGPVRRWMCGDVAMHDAPCPDLHQEEHIESSKPGRHHDQEIAGEHGLGMIANKRPPVLRRSPPFASSLRFWRPIGAHCAWRNIDAQLHRKLRGHARLAPSWILFCHLHDEFADVLRNSCFCRNRTSALRAVRERNRRRKKRSPSATRSVIKLSKESSERFALGKNRDMGCQDGIRSAQLRSVFCQAGLASCVFLAQEGRQISANISARWEPVGIFAYHNGVRQSSRKSRWPQEGHTEQNHRIDQGSA